MNLKPGTKVYWETSYGETYTGTILEIQGNRALIKRTSNLADFGGFNTCLVSIKRLTAY